MVADDGPPKADIEQYVDDLQKARAVDRKDIFGQLTVRAWWLFDGPVTWFRTTFVEPNRAKNKLPYYHQKMARGPTIDECGVEDSVCRFQADSQYRLDKMVDGNILGILRDRVQYCMDYTGMDNFYQCAKFVHDYEQADLNFFVKYGELGFRGSALAAYMKQKHRLIWERRHPDVMAEREREYKKYMEDLDNGIFNNKFWTAGFWWEDKKARMSKVFRGHVFRPQDLPDEEPVYSVKVDDDGLNR